MQNKKNQKAAQLRPPIVVVLGHVDHGKSTLLDFLRKSNITAKEHGGITQHIGAYQVKLKSGKYITFIDTPGHEAFAKLRARGAKVADLALLVVAADDSVKPQTVESIKYIKKAGIPFIVAINKIDLADVNVEKVKKDLLKYDVAVEEKGGKIACLPISAKTGKGIADLLETIILVAEMKKISGEPEGDLEGVIIEAALKQGRGNVATVLVKNGTLKAGEKIKAGEEEIKVRAMFDENGINVRQAGPGKPVEVLGFKKLPVVGTILKAADIRKRKRGKVVLPSYALRSSSSDLRSQDTSFLKIVLKADKQGSLEAILDGLPKGTEVVSSGIGDITENDVSFAKTTKAVIVAFNVKASLSILKLADDEKVKIRIYQIIYKLFEELEEVVKLLKEGPEEEILGKGKIIQEFLVKKEKIAGVQVIKGRLAVGDKAKILRGEKEVKMTRIKSLKQQKEKINKAEKGEECGIKFNPEVDFRVGDVVESFQTKS